MFLEPDSVGLRDAALTHGKIGLALGGGAARGWAHIGVLKRLTEAGLRPDIVVGTSIGAVVGGCYVANKLGVLEEFACGLTRRKIFGLLDFNLTGSGLITGRRLCERLDQHLSELSIEELERRFVAVATELGSGHEVWLSRGRLVEAMCASYALPGVFHPVNINNRWLIDGALVNPIPVSVCRALGARFVIAINLHSDSFGTGTVVPDQGADEDTVLPSDPQAEIGNPAKRSARHLLHRQFFGRGGDGAPGISSVMIDAFNIIQDRVARSRLAGDPPDLIIAPKLPGFGLFEFHRAAEMIKIGEAAAEREISHIQEAVGPIAA